MRRNTINALHNLKETKEKAAKADTFTEDHAQELLADLVIVVERLAEEVKHIHRELRLIRRG